jgi:hypothetical protein
MFGVSVTTWVLASLCIFLAAFIRGFTGFGLAVVGVPLLSLFFAPAEIVPSIMILAILAGAQLIPKIWRRVDWKLLAPTVLGCAIGTPLGTWLLAGVSANLMRVLIGGAVLAAAMAMQLGFKFKQRPQAGVSAGFGAVAGLTGGAAAMPGPSVIFLFLAVPGAHEVGRASLVLFFQASQIMSAVSATFGGLMQIHSLLLGALLVPAMLVGNWLGDRVFDKASAKAYRTSVVLLLAGVGAVAAIRGLVGLAKG